MGYKLFAVGASDTYEKVMFAGVRFFLSSIMIFLFCIVKRWPLKVAKADLHKLANLGLMQTAIQFTFFYIGLSNTSGTRGSILVAINTFFSVIIAHFFFEEDKLTTKKIAKGMNPFIILG